MLHPSGHWITSRVNPAFGQGPRFPFLQRRANRTRVTCPDDAIEAPDDDHRTGPLALITPRFVAQMLASASLKPSLRCLGCSEYRAHLTLPILSVILDTEQVITELTQPQVKPPFGFTAELPGEA